LGVGSELTYFNVRPLAVCLLSFACLSHSSIAATTGNFDLEQHEGKVVIVDFWASWCVPCRRSFPWLNEMHARYGDKGLVIIGVNLDASRAEAEDFLREYPARFFIHYDDDKTLAKEFDVMAMPMSYVFGRDGRQITRHFGFKVKKQAEYEAIIVEALSEQE
jgi:thiol-disulfide isomerase/thioredoxin